MGDDANHIGQVERLRAEVRQLRRAMADPKNTETINTDAGHLAVHVSGVHAPDLTVSFERPQSGVGVGGSVAAHLLLAAIAIFIATYSTTPAVSLPPAREALPADIVWLDVPGPGGGGGGGGNQMPDPPKKAEVPGKEAVSVPAQPPETPRPEPPKPEVEQQPLEIPAKTMGDVAAIVPGSLDTALDASLSQGIGVGGGAGTGQGTGIGSGRGSGLGEGFGKGTGGGYIAGGVEMMSRVPMGSDGAAIAVDPSLALKAYFVPQGISADIIATEFGFSRDDCDALAVESQKRAARAWEDGRFAKSIVPVKDINGLPILDRDEHMRPETDMQSLGALKPSFKEMGETMPGFDAVAILKYPHLEKINHVHHAGNSSGIVDGAAAVLIGDKAFGDRHGLKPRARIKATAKIGTDPTIMLTGPVPVTEKILRESGMGVADIDLFEVNEAFAAVVLRFVHEMTTAEIAGVLGRSEGAVRVLIHRGLRSVAADLRRGGR